MAANLLSGLDDYYSGRTSSDQNPVHPQNDTHSTTIATKQLAKDSERSVDLLHGLTVGRDETQAIDEDDFGEFEVSQPIQPVGWKHEHHLERSPSLAKRLLRKPRDTSVLFDAEDEEVSDGDDFGDFERAENNDSVPHDTEGAKPNVNLIDVESPTDHLLTKLAAGKPNKVPASHDRGLSLLQRQLDQKPTPSKVEGLVKTKPTDIQSSFNDADWDDFETQTAPVVSDALAYGAVTTPGTVSGTPSQEGTQKLSEGQLPFRLESLLADSVPSSPQVNIPPPSILLSVFSTVADKARGQFFEPISQAADNPDVLQAAYAHPQVHSYLQSLLTLSTVLCRITAGRKHRWKRDKILAQSMSIGQASAGGRSGGMKLTGLDKAETAREGRDVADAVRAWRNILGRMRSAVSAARKVGTVPEIKEDYTVRTGTDKEGAIQATKHCALCGLKRNERIAKVDIEVQDSFGEWWVEHWGHRDCARFWQTYEKSLKGK